MLAPDIQSEASYYPQGLKTFDGIDMVMRDFRQIKAFESFRLDIVEVLDAGGTAIVECRSQGARDGWPDYASHYLFVLSFRDWFIMRWRELYNPLEAMKQGVGVAQG